MAIRIRLRAFPIIALCAVLLGGLGANGASAARGAGDGVTTYSSTNAAQQSKLRPTDTPAGATATPVVSATALASATPVVSTTISATVTSAASAPITMPMPSITPVVSIDPTHTTRTAVPSVSATATRATVVPTATATTAGKKGQAPTATPTGARPLIVAAATGGLSVSPSSGPSGTQVTISWIGTFACRDSEAPCFYPVRWDDPSSGPSLCTISYGYISTQNPSCNGTIPSASSGTHTVYLVASGCSTGCTAYDTGTFTIPAPPTNTPAPTATPAAPALAASYSSNPPTSWNAGQTQIYNVTVTNTGSQTWNAGGSNPVHLGIHFGTSSDGIGDGWATDQRFTLATDVPPGGSQTLTVAVVAPTTSGAYVLRARMVKELVAWFNQIQKTTVAVAPPLPGVVPIQNNGFEAPPLGGGYQYNPSGAFWTFNGGSPNGSGVTSNGNPFTSGNPNAPENNQVAFLQGIGAFQQTIGPFQAGVSYVVSFAAAQRGNCCGNGGEDFRVTLDGAPLGTFKPSGTGYAAYATLPFTATAGSHTLAFTGLDTAGGDNSAFIDAVRVATLIPNSGFEAPALGGGYQYTPSGAGWVFGANPSASGITGNGSGFTGGNPNAPEGSQVAFLQGTGSFQQSIGPLQAGTGYAITFATAQRGNCCAGNGSAQDFQVLLDGATVGTFTPTGVSYRYLTTGVFTATAGMHALSFAGLDTAGGDNTAFIDDVRLTTYPTLVGAGAIPWHPHQSVRFADRLSAQVDLFDGHVDVSTNDLSIPGRGPDLTVDHTWDSALAAAGVAGASGAGWQSSLTPSMGGQLQGTVVYSDSSGAVWPFVYTGALAAIGPYTAYTVTPGRPWQLTTSTAGYTLTNFLTSEVLAFDAQGRYLSDTDAYGNQNSMTQGANGPTKDTNSGGRALAFTYSNGLLADAQSPLWQQSGAGAAGSQHVAYGYTNGQLSSLTWGAGTGDATTANFGYTGKLLTGITTGSGHQWTLGYDPQGRVTSITSPISGQVGQAGYTPSYITRMTYGVSQTVVVEGYGTSSALTHTYTLDAQGQATQTTDGLGDTSSVSYDTDHDVLTSTDANGHTTTNAYQYVGPTGSAGLITQTVRPAVNVFTPRSVPNPIVTTYRYDPHSYDLLETDTPAGGIERYAYDGAHSVITTTLLTGYAGCPQANVSVSMPMGAIQPFGLPQCSYVWQPRVTRYDAYGERVAEIDGRGLAVTGDATPTVTLVDPQGLYTSHMTYNTQGDQTSASTPPITTTLTGITTTAPVTTTQGYDGDGNQTTTVSANGNTTTLAYDHLGRQTNTTLPLVKLYDNTTTTPVETTGYDGDGNVVSSTDANSDLTTSSYDPLDRQVATTNPVSGTTLLTYTATELAATQDMAGNVSRDAYDGAGRLLLASDPATGTVGYGYDAVGNTTAITAGDSSGAVTQLETRGYDAQNRVMTDTVGGAPGSGAPSLTTLTYYDYDGNVAQVRQPNGDTTVSVYDFLDRPTSTEIDTAVVDAPTKQTVESSHYDAAGNVDSSIDFDGRTHLSQYDADNRTVQSTDYYSFTATLTTTLGYDPDGNTLRQVQQTQGPAGGVQTHTITTTYNAADWEMSTSDDGLLTRYGYDAAGQQRSHTIVDGTTPVTSVLDAEGRTTSIVEGLAGAGPYTATYGYNRNDLVTSATLPGSIQEQAGYDANSQLTSRAVQGPHTGVMTTTLSTAYAYGYNATGWLTSTTTISGTDAITHDAQGRLTADCGAQVQVRNTADHCDRWTYDGNGNLTSQVADNGATTAYTIS